MKKMIIGTLIVGALIGIGITSAVIETKKILKDLDNIV